MLSQKPGAVASSPRGKRRRLAAVIPLLVVVGITSVVAWSAWPLLRPAREVRVAQAVFERTSSTTGTEQSTEQEPTRDVPAVQAAGWLEAEPFFVACAALADGVVESIKVLEGQQVKQGDIVATLVAEDAELRLRRARGQLADAQAKLKLAQAEHAAAKRAWEEPVELERAVEAGKAALAEAKAELAQLPSLVASAEATLLRLDEEYQRVAKLEIRQASTRIEVVIARQRVVAQRAEVKALNARQPMLEARVDRLAADLRASERDLKLRIDDRRRLDVAEASVESAEAAVAQAEAIRDEAKLELDRMVIRAPISGYVMRRLKSPGDKAIRGSDSRHSAHLVHIYDPNRLQVRVDVPLADAANVYVGQPCEVVVEVLPNRTFKGKVIRSTHEADLQKNTLQFKVQVLDPDPVLRPEMLTRVKFLASGRGAKAGADGAASTMSRVLIPKVALDERGGEPRVWVVTERTAGRGRLQPQRVQQIEEREGWLLVAGDVQPGALVALEFADAAPGEEVRVRNDEAGGQP